MRTLAISLLLLMQTPILPAGRMDVARYANGAISSVQFYRDDRKVGVHGAWWPNGALRSMAQYSEDAYDGLYRTWYESGAPYEARTFVAGREAGIQQSWTADGQLYLNYEVRDGRRYGMVNAKPCVPVTSVALPYYDSADFTPRWRPTSARRLTFDLQSQTGARVTGADLAGRAYIASFIFARCSTVCPALVQQLKRAQEATSVRLVSYTVTPAVDTPDVLASFGASRGIDPSRWLLLTGDAAAIYRAARTFYFAGDSRASGSDDEFLHTEKVLLVDGAGRLRGVYDGTLPFEIDRLIADAKTLASGS
jgi:protein SCO1/2